MKRKCLEDLELPEDATMLEIKTAYQHLKDLYTKGSIAISPIEDEYPEEAKEEIIRKIDEAFAWLNVNYQTAGSVVTAGGKGTSSRASKAALEEVSSIEEYDGPNLKRIREILGIELGEVEFSTKISLQHIKNIELGNYKALPEEVFVKGYIASYAKCLGLEVPRAVDEFMKHYRKERL